MSLIDHILTKLHLSETRQKIVRNLLWAVTGKVVTLLGSLLVGIFVARYLGPEQYGLMQYVVSYVALFQVFASFGMDNIEIREEAKCTPIGSNGRTPDIEANKLLGTAFGLKICFAALTMCAVILTAWLFEADEFTKWMITLYSFSMITSSFSVIRNYFTAILWNEYIVKTEISRTIVGASIKVVLLLLHAPLAWFIAATLFDTVLIAGGYLLSYRRQIASPRLWQFDRETSRYLIKQSFPLMISLSAVIIYQRVDQIMIGNMIDKEAVGYYSVANSIESVILFIPTILCQTITPIFVQLYRGSREMYQQKAQIFLDIVIWLTILACVCVSMCSSILIKWLYGIQYMPAIGILQICIFKAVGYAQAQASSILILTEEKQQWFFIRNFIGCFFAVGLNILLLPTMGVIGAAIASVITSLITGYFSHICIPPYHHIFKLQTYSFLLGWRSIGRTRDLLKHT